jgi:hypothetical protein
MPYHTGFLTLAFSYVFIVRIAEPGSKIRFHVQSSVGTDFPLPPQLYGGLLAQTLSQIRIALAYMRRVTWSVALLSLLTGSTGSNNLDGSGRTMLLKSALCQPG